MSEKELVIDPGHGGKDPGAVGNGLREKDLTLDISKKIKAYMEKTYEGIKVTLTRSTDVFLELSERADIANKAKADYFASIHINAGGGNGWESYIYNGGVGAFTVNAQKIVNSHVMEVIKKYGSKAHGDDSRSANFAVIRESNMGAILTENLFIDSSDSNLLKKAEFIQDLSEAHGDGFAEVLGLKKKVVQAPAPKPIGEAKYTVQVGAFSEYDNAKNQLSALEKAGFKGFIKEVK